MNLRFKVLGKDSKNAECFAILSMMQLCFKESSHNIYISRLIADYGKIFVTFHRDDPICVIETLKNWNDPHDAQIISVATHPKFQSQGIGFFTAKKMINWLASHGIDSIEVKIPPGHTEMLEIFKEKLGFNVINEIKDYYGPNQNRLCLQKKLNYKRGRL